MNRLYRNTMLGNTLEKSLDHLFAYDRISRGSKINKFRIKKTKTSKNLTIMELRLFKAIEHNCQKSFVETLLQTVPSANIKDPISGRTALYHAVFNNNSTIAELLLQHGANPTIDPDLLQVAVRNGSLEMVDLLVRYDVRIDGRLPLPGKTPLQVAVETNQSGIAELLIHRGATVFMPEVQTRTKLLHIALFNWNEPLSVLLAEHSRPANKDFLDYGHATTLRLAVHRGYTRVVQECINKGANVNDLPMNYNHEFLNRNLLQIAVKNRDRNMVEFLARNGVENDHISLHYAISQRYNDIVTLLLDTGLGDANGRCMPNSLTPLFYAVQNDDHGMVRLLLKSGANVNEIVPFQCGNLLDIAIRWRHETVSKILIERGATSVMIIGNHDENIISNNLIIKLLAELVFVNPNMKNIASYNWQAIQMKDRHREYYELCLEELAKMRKKKIFNDLTFCDLMSKNANQLAAYARNEEFEAVFLKSEYLFPIYFKDLAPKFDEARFRAALLEKAEEVFGGLKQFALPAVCVRKVLQCLEDEELKNFIKGNCDCKDRHECGPEIILNF